MVLWVLMSLVLAILGPFGSHAAFGFWERLGFWSPCLALAIVVSAGVRVFVYGTLGLTNFLSVATASTGLICLLICPPFCLLVSINFGMEKTDLSGVIEVVLLVASVSMGVCALRQSVQPLPDKAKAPANIVVPRLVARLEPVLHGALEAISVRDHYVDVRTSAGQGSLLMRFGDAMAEAEPAVGAQVHRSHWVAWEAVRAVEREGDKVYLRLNEGQRVPVSKNHRVKLEARGLI